jgi:hypothetical protein
MKSIKQLLESYNYKNKMTFHLMVEGLLSLDEGKVNPEVLELIQNNEFETDAKAFQKSLNKSKHAEMLTDYDVKDLKKMKLFKVKGYNIGFALKKKDGKHQEIVAVHNNEPTVKGIGKDLMKSAIANGGVYLDHFSGYLDNFYSSLGFVEYDRDKFDPQYDEDGSFRAKYGEADVVYRKLK